MSLFLFKATTGPDTVSMLAKKKSFFLSLPDVMGNQGLWLQLSLPLWRGGGESSELFFPHSGKKKKQKIFLFCTGSQMVQSLGPVRSVGRIFYYAHPPTTDSLKRGFFFVSKMTPLLLLFFCPALGGLRTPPGIASQWEGRRIQVHKEKEYILF